MFFDNLQVTHTRGPILEETHYYPFGLTMAGISSKAANTLENKKKYQQYELNTDFDINLYESFYRSHDPQLGRFWQVDPKPTDFESPYAAMGNNPIKNIDMLGDTIVPIAQISVKVYQGGENGNKTTIYKATNGSSSSPTIAVGFRSDADVCDDGPTSGPTSPTHQSTTAYTIGGKYLDPNAITYFVAPGGEALKQIKAAGVEMGDLGVAVYKDSNGKAKATYGIIGETGPSNKTGEMSINGIKELGLPVLKNQKGQIVGGGVDANAVNYYFFPKSKGSLEAITGKNVMPTQAQIVQAGKSYIMSSIVNSSSKTSEFRALYNILNSTPLIKNLD